MARAAIISPDEFGKVCAQALEQKIQELGPRNVAAFIGEPIQGAGGVIIPPQTYWPEIQKICKKHDILLIADEVICGFGRTGLLVRLGALRHRGGLHDPRQGHHLGLSAALGDHGRGPGRGRAERDGRLRPWLHLFRPSGRLCGRDREYPHPQGREAGRSRARRDRALSRQEDAGVPDHPLVGEVRNLA
jgi:hypothetical protein